MFSILFSQLLVLNLYSGPTGGFYQEGN